MAKRREPNGGKRSGKLLCRYSALYGSDAGAHRAYRALLRWHLRVIEKNCPGALEGLAFHHLHDIRVAMRRMRAVLQFFRGLPGVDRERELEALLKSLCAAMGEIRDLQVVAELVQSMCTAPNLKLEGYRRKCLQEMARAMPRLKKIIRGKEWRSCISTVDGLVDRLPSRGAAVDEVDMKSFAAAGIAKKFRRIESEAFSGIDALTGAGLHELRKRIRKLRYSVEICSPVLGRRMKHAEAIFKRVTDLLGGIHDADMSLALISQSSDAAARKVISEVLKARREEALKHLRLAMKVLKREVKGREMQKYLKGCF